MSEAESIEEVDLKSPEFAEAKRGLAELQTNGAVVIGDMRRSNRSLYLQLGQIYLWWRSVKDVPGYLDAEYKAIGRKKTRKVRYGINYNSLLWLVFGFNTGMDGRIFLKWSKALNPVHNEFEDRPDYYASDTLEKIANFIDIEGGIEGLCGFDASEEEFDDDCGEGKTPIKPTPRQATKQEIQSVLLTLSSLLRDYGQKDFIPYDPYLSINSSKYGLLLVEKTDGGINVIGTQDAPEFLEPVLAENVRRRFDITDMGVRPLLELIQTQCLPANLEGMAEALTDTTRLKEEGKKKFTNYRRVLYRPSHNEFILSPVNALSGVVSLVRPYFPLILNACDKDVFLSPQDRSHVESVLLRQSNFNLYDTNLDSDYIPHYEESNSASHVVVLRNRIIAQDFLVLSFWPFYDTLEQPQDQLLPDPSYQLQPKWHAHIERSELKRLNDQFLIEWMKEYALHFKRDPNARVKVTFSKDQWLIEFYYQNGQFELNEPVSMQYRDVSEQPVTAIFASRDWIPVFHSLACLPINDAEDRRSVVDDEEWPEAFIPEEADNYRGGVLLELDENVLTVHFHTQAYGGSEHIIYIPTVDEKVTRSTAPFMRYHPQVTEDQHKDVELSDVIEQWPEALDIDP